MSERPGASVDIFAPPEAREGRAWRLLSLLPLAAFGFALVAWGATAVLALKSETLGLRGATVAMFPTGFGAAGLIVRQHELLRPRASTTRLLLFSCGGGVLAMLLFAFFMATIWPAL